MYTKQKFRDSLLPLLKSSSEAVFSSAVDISLWTIVYFAELGTFGSPYRKVWKARMKADRFLEETNYLTIREAIQNAKRKGYVTISHKNSLPEITRIGKKRLSSTLPFYDEKRVWDRKIYLVTYDVPEKLHYSRDKFRRYLVKLGAGKLQDSVWLTPYDPTESLKEYIDNLRLKGTIIISTIGKDGSIGNEAIGDLIIRLYNLKSLNERYETIINDSHDIDLDIIMRFLAILHDDPQLPFILLPNWWLGDKAYKKIKPLLKSMYFRLRP